MKLKLAVRSGGIIPVLLMLPNVAWMLFYSLDADAKDAVAPALSIAENVVRSVALALPLLGGGPAALWSAPLLAVPSPLALAPVAFLLLSSNIVQLDPFGLRARDVQPADPKAYHIYGARVLAPCAGHGAGRGRPGGTGGGRPARHAGAGGGPRASGGQPCAVALRQRGRWEWHRGRCAGWAPAVR